MGLKASQEKALGDQGEEGSRKERVHFLFWFVSWADLWTLFPLATPPSEP